MRRFRQAPVIAAMWMLIFSLVKASLIGETTAPTNEKHLYIINIHNCFWTANAVAVDIDRDASNPTAAVDPQP